ncbi:PREDICTED: uncharacterized protein LOC106741241, partial [Dinoponera quadriceps]|uniref:Uncharacterized protein LOC106741241 n=1 Tax=Dinoponera quadriceps TaxID=609295 RepID=A0A6P3WS27_DINQU
RTVPQTYGDGFLGDVEVGNHRTEEIILYRVIVFNNPTNDIQSGSVQFSHKGISHYLSVVNQSGSQAIVCNNPDSLGTSKVRLNIRVHPNTDSTLDLILASH